MIYFDNNATTRPLPGVIEVVRCCMQECYANPASATVSFTGADQPRREAAQAIAELLGAEEPECITFTSGATESNNWVFHGVAQQTPGRIIISAIEHPSVREPAEALAKKGFEVCEAPVDPDGTLNVAALAELLSPTTVLVSLLAAHNETGAIQPIRQASALTKERSPALFHTDATQLVGKRPVDLGSAWPDVDFLSFSAHKFHGPKGIGGLYLRPGIELPALLLGGGQEAGRRSGTSNSPALAGVAIAARTIKTGRANHVQQMRDELEGELRQLFPALVIHAEQAERIPNTTFFSIPGTRGEELIEQLAVAGIIASTGSACSSGSVGPSKCLLAMGVDYDLAEAALRISLSRFTEAAELKELLYFLENVLPSPTLP